MLTTVSFLEEVYFGKAKDVVSELRSEYITRCCLGIDVANTNLPISRSTTTFRDKRREVRPPQCYQCYDEIEGHS